MIDKNYLGHKLEHYTYFYPHYDFKCEKCNIILYYNEQDKYQYNLCDGNCLVNLGPKCNLTCDEYIIKNIIE